MALQRVETDAIQDDAVTTAKIAANAVAAADIAADAITNAKVASNAAIAVSKITGLGTAATLTAGTSANNVVQLDGSARLPAVNGANLTGVSTDTSAMENNIAILAFKTQSANNLAKFNLIDQVIDEYKDGTGATYTTAAQDGTDATSGYISSMSTTFGSPVLGNGVRTSSITVTSNVTVATGAVVNLVSGNGGTANADNAQLTNHAFDWAAHTPNAGTYIRFEFGSAVRATEIEWFQQGTGTNGTWKWQGSNTAGGGSGYVDLTSAIPFTGVRESNPTNNASNKDNYVVTADLSSNNTAYKYYQMMYVSGAVLYYWNEEVEFTTTTIVETTNATGTATSTANTALSAPTTGDICMLIEEVDGVAATLNTSGNDLRCAISRNGGTGWDYVTLANKGSWGTNKKILVANNVAFSNSASGTDMRYKLEWANQVASVDGVGLYQDSSSNAHTITAVADATTSTTIKKFGTHSMQFDGTGDWYTVPDGSWADLGTGDFTMEAWVYYTGGSGWKGIIGSGNWGGPNYDWTWDMNSANAYPRLSIYNGSTEVFVQMTTAVATSTWTHLAVCRSGGTITQYLNGTANGTTVSSTHNVVSNGVVYIGNQSRGIPWQGNIQEVRISNNARYTSNFTSFGQDGGTIASPSNFTSDANTKLLVHGSGTDAVAGKVVRVHATSLAWA